MTCHAHGDGLVRAMGSYGRWPRTGCMDALAAPKRAEHALQVKTMGYWGLTSFLWDFFKWFFQGDPSSPNCGFTQFPSLGITALGQSWNFDWQLNYCGVGERAHGWYCW